MKKLPRVLFLLLGLSLTAPLLGGANPKKIPVTTAKPKENKVYPIAIIGAGAGGTMALKRAILNNREVLLFSGAKKEIKRSRGNWVRKVQNIPGLDKYSRTIVELRDETLNDIVSGPFKKNFFLVPESVTALKKEGDLFRLQDSSGHSYLAQYVVLATGMMDEQPHIQGSIKPVLSYANNQTIAYCMLCDGHRAFQKNTAVIGHSDDAGRGACLLMDRYHPAKVILLTNGHQPEFSEETKARLQAKNIQVVESPIKKVLGDKKILKGFQFESAKEVAVEMGFVALGIRPNNSLAKQIDAQLDMRGLVLTDANGETSVANLFVVGDLRANSTKQIYTAWQHAVDAIQLIDHRIRTEQK